MSAREHARSKREAESGGQVFVTLVLAFFAMSFAGLIGESVVSFFQDGFWKDRAGMIWGPFSPIYGLGAVILTLVLRPVRDKGLVPVFLLAALIGAAFEWSAGFFFEQAFGIVAWSYEGQPGNIGGYTSLVMAAAWGLLGTLWIMAVYPHFAQLASLIPRKVGLALATVATALFVVDAAFTIVAFDCWYHRSAGAPPDGIVQQFFAEHFGDEYMAGRFETMSIWPDLAGR